MALTNESGTKVEEYFYDAWGQRKNPANWSQNDTCTNLITDRGYTGHEHWDKFNLINMNGRVYDPALGRFLSADPTYQTVEYSQGFNKYSYVLNNPFKYTDPTGYTFKPDGWDGEVTYTVGSFGNCIGNRYDFSNVFNRADTYFASTYKYDPNSSTGYRNGLGQEVTYGEVFNNYIVSNINKMQETIILNVFQGRGNWTDDETAVVMNPFGSLAVYTEFVINTTSSILSIPQGQGGMPGWASDVNTGINAFGVANSAKTELIDYTVRSNYKSARTWSEFNNLRSSQQAWRTTNTLGKTGASYLKYAKGLGYFGAGLTTAYSVTTAYNYFNNGGTDWSVYTKSGLDVIMTGVGFLGPIGFGISASYFILDATTGGFGGFGQIKP